MRFSGSIHCEGSSLAGQTLATERPDSRETDFRAVSSAPQLASGPTLLVEAYAAIWILLFGFVLLGWRRLRRIEARMDDLSRELSRDSATKETP